MRALVIAALALVLASCVSAGDFTQADARAVEDRWKNCSQIVSGRLGAMYTTPTAVVYKDKQWNVSTGETKTWSRINVHSTWSPCVRYTSETDHFLTVSFTDNVTGGQLATYSWDKVVVVEDPRLLTFTMPVALGQVATITMNYQDTTGNSPDVQVLAQCPTGDNTDSGVSTGKIKFTNATFDKDGTLVSLIYTTQDACAHFPYTNKAVPPGGVAAIIIVIVCFILQFGACFHYHKTHVEYNPIDVDAQ